MKMENVEWKMENENMLCRDGKNISEHKSILGDCREIFALLTAIIKSAKNQPV